jgi:hypothetical protein
MLRSRTTRREDPLGPRTPDPIITRQGSTDPEHQVLLADSVGIALLVVLEMLPPAERLDREDSAAHDLGRERRRVHREAGERGEAGAATGTGDGAQGSRRQLTHDRTTSIPDQPPIL